MSNKSTSRITHVLCMLALAAGLLACEQNATADSASIAATPKSSAPIIASPDVAATKALDIITNIPDFAAYKDVKAKKSAFFNFMAPMIQTENKTIFANRQWLQSLQANALNTADHARLQKLAKHYKVDISDNLDAMVTKLLSRVDIVPVSMVLAQSANESAWGTSRFAKQGLNFFGQWCFSKGCGIVPSQRSTGMHHEVRRFASVNESVAAYLVNLNTNRAFKKFRNIRAVKRSEHAKLTGHDLMAGLINYSERKEAYIKEIRSMIRFNKLSQYAIQ